MSADTAAVISRLRDCSVGDVVAWEELEKLTGRHRDEVRQMVRNARRKLQREHKMHFQTVVGSGVERIDYGDVADHTLHSMRKGIAGKARRMVQVTKDVVLEKLDQSQRATVLTHQTLGQLTEQACSNKNAKLLSKEIENDNILSPLSPREAMARWLAK